MAVILSAITTLVRNLIGEIVKSDSDLFTYSSSNVFTLTESNVTSVTSVSKNDVTLSTSDWSYNSATNKVTVTATMVTGDAIEILYSFYNNYSTTEIEGYIKAAVIHISANNYKNFIIESSTIYPEPTGREENLIAMIAGLLIEPDNKSYRLPDMSVSVPNDLPVHEKIRRTIAIFKKDTYGVLDVI